MDLTFDEALLLWNLAQDEIANAKKDLHLLEDCKRIGCVTEKDMVELTKYHKGRIKTATGCVEKLNQIMERI